MGALDSPGANSTTLLILRLEDELEWCKGLLSDTAGGKTSHDAGEEMDTDCFWKTRHTE